MKNLVIPQPLNGISFEEYLNKVIWPLAYWRTSGLDVLSTALELRVKLTALIPGDTVLLTDKEYEELSKRVGVPEMSAMPPELVPAAWTFAYAILTSKSPTPQV